MANGGTQSQDPTVRGGGAVDLNSPFFRQLETDRGLPSGVLSAMAEKESGGNALKRASDPNSSASGLFQINNATGRDWGLSAADRLDPMKSATAVADVLARRANQYGIERAVGMHYGGVGSPWDQPVGSSGLSPASYSGDVFNRAQKYAGGQPPNASVQPQYASVEPTRVGFPSPAFEEEPAAPGPSHYETPYSIQRPDGSIDSGTLHTDQPVTHAWLGNYARSFGGTYLGPEAPAPAAPPQAAAPPPAPAAEPFVGPPQYVPPEVQRMQSPAVEAQWAAERARTAPSPMPPAPGPSPVPPEKPPSLMQAFGGYDLGGGAPLSYALAPPVPPGAPTVEAPPWSPGESVGDVFVPHRSLQTQVPSILGATVLAPIGAGMGLPLGPEVSLATGALGGGVGSTLGEGTTILSEKITGAPPAEPGSAMHRLENAFVRGAGGELIWAPIRYGPATIAAKAAPVARAFEEVGPVLNNAETQLGQWWQTISQKAPATIVDAWNKLGETGQALMAGRYLPSMQKVIGTIEETMQPLTRGEMAGGVGVAGGVQRAVETGNPYHLVAPAVVAARLGAARGVPWAASIMSRTPRGLEWLSRLPAVGRVAEPLVIPLRAGAQAVAAKNFPTTAQIFEPEQP